MTYHPRIDKTGTSRGVYLVGAPCGPSYGHGRPVDAKLSAAGWTAQGAPEDAAELLRILNGPRRVHMQVYYCEPLDMYGTVIAEWESHVTALSDPEDHRAWVTWIAEEATKWLADHFPGGPKAGHYQIDAQDLDIAHCAGGGYWNLGHHEVLVPDGRAA